MTALPVNSIPTAIQQSHYSNTNYLKDNFLFISESDDPTLQHANFIRISHDGSILPMSQASAHESKAFKTEKLPQRPETSTGNKTKQMLLLQQNIKTKALMQVYGQHQNMQRKEPHSDLLSSSGKSRSSQARAQSQTNVFSKREKRGPQIKKQVNQNQKNVYSNNPSEFEQLNQILNNESQELTIIESPQKKMSYNNGVSTVYSQLTKSGIQNKKNIEIANTKLDLNQILYFQNGQLANETKRTSQPGSSHLIHTQDIHQDGQVSTPLSIQFQNSQSQNMKKQRNLKNFSAQSAAIDGGAASFSSTQNQYNQNNDQYNYSNQNANTLVGAEAQKHMQFKMSEIKIMQNISISKQGSMQNVRRNTQCATNQTVLGPNGERGGSRYKTNKQSSNLVVPQNQAATILNPSNHSNLHSNHFQAQAQKIGLSSSMNNNNNKQISIFNNNLNAISGGQKSTNQSKDINNNSKLNSILANLQNQNVYVAVNSSTLDKKGQLQQNQINIQGQRPQSLINKGRQSFKEIINDKQINERLVSEPLDLVQQYHSSNQNYNNYNFIRNSIQQDNFFTGQNLQEACQIVKPKSLALQNFLAINQPHQPQQQAQRSSKSSKAPSISAAGVKYSHQLIQPSQGFVDAAKLNILQTQQRQLILQNQKQMNKTPQILPQKVQNGNFSRKLTINSNKIIMQGMQEQGEKRGEIGINGDFLYQHNNASLQMHIQNTISNAKQNLKASEEFRSQKGTLIYCQSPISISNNESRKNSEAVEIQGKVKQSSQAKLNNKAIIKNNERYSNNLQDSYDSNIKFIDINQLTQFQGNKQKQSWAINENQSIEHTEIVKDVNKSIMDSINGIGFPQKALQKKQKTVNFNNEGNNTKANCYKQSTSELDQQQHQNKSISSLNITNTSAQRKKKIVKLQRNNQSSNQNATPEASPNLVINNKNKKDFIKIIQNQRIMAAEKQQLLNNSENQKQNLKQTGIQNPILLEKNTEANTINILNAPQHINNASNRLSLEFPQQQKNKNIKIQNSNSKINNSKVVQNNKKDGNQDDGSDFFKIDEKVNEKHQFSDEIRFQETPTSPEQKQQYAIDTKRGMLWDESALTNDLNSYNVNITNQSEIREYQFLAEEELPSKSFYQNQIQNIQSNFLNKNEDNRQLSGGERGKGQAQTIKNQSNLQNNIQKQAVRNNVQLLDGSVFVNNNNNQKNLTQQKGRLTAAIITQQDSKNESNNNLNELIKIQDNNFNSLKKSKEHNESGVKKNQEQNTQLIVKSKSLANEKLQQQQKSRSQSKNHSLRQSKNNRSGAGLNWAQGNLGNVLKNSQSQKRLNQMRKQMNQNRLKELPNKIHEPDQQVKQQNQQKKQINKQNTKPATYSVSALEEDELQDSVFNQIKKPPQVPSLGTKIQQAQKQQISQLPDGRQFSEEVSAGVSGISTVGGGNGNEMQTDQAGGTDYHSNNNAYAHSRQDGFDLKRKNSSILSTANRYYLQINTPSALGYTSVLLGGTNNTIFTQIPTQNLYNNLQYHEDPEVFAQQLLFDSDRIWLDQYRQNEHFKLLVDPLGQATNPFMNFPDDLKLEREQSF